MIEHGLELLASLIDLIAFRAGMMGSLVPNAGLRRGLTLRVEPWPGEAKPDLVAVCLGK